jgi:hypothetical protein
MTTVHDQACFGVYADREALPDVDMLAHDIDDAITELLACARRIMKPTGSLRRAHAAAPSAPRLPCPEPLKAPVEEALAAEPVGQPTR